MSYTIEFRPAARREFKKLPAQFKKQITLKIDSLADNPRPVDTKKLQDSPLGTDLYRVRVGDYRIIYSIFDKMLIVLIVKIGGRGDVY